ncbi:hypothetical protein [Nocardioides sp.]|uniref:hypothetical protein n=1 Tax=Nocardioides sp. TaxID=35761 RepID=UPI003511CA9E
MKKMALALLASVAVAPGLAAGAAQAAPYPGSVPTTTTINRVVPPAAVGDPVIVRATVGASGTAVTAGSVSVTCSVVANNRTFTRTGNAFAYVDANQRIRGPVLNRAGTWACRVLYTGDGSVFADSSSDPAAVVVS